MQEAPKMLDAMAACSAVLSQRRAGACQTAVVAPSTTRVGAERGS